jgi:RNA polymerase sigma factor (sigma-70 family)
VADGSDGARREQGGRGHFATTHWSLVLAAAGPETIASREALAALCRVYWYPLYAYARRFGYPVEHSEDLVQSFFVHVLEKHSLEHARSERGRFRSFLLTSFKHFAVNEYDRARAAKRGGGEPLAALDVSSGERRYSLDARDDVNPEVIFDRGWAMTVIDRVQLRLRSSFVRSGKGALFERLRDFVMDDGADTPCRDIGAALGMSEGAVRVAVHRFRRRFRDVLREEIQQTVANGEEIDDEIRFLLAAIGDVGPRRRF